LSLHFEAPWLRGCAVLRRSMPLAERTTSVERGVVGPVTERETSEVKADEYLGLS
jgi:hypothetical protein